MKNHFVFNIRESIKVLWDEPRIFFDCTTLSTGTPLNANIIRALNRSKVFICLFTPEYFESEWCRKELSIIFRRIQLMREHQLIPREYSPVMPIRFKDGRRYPDLVNDLVMFTELQDRDLVSSKIANSHPLATELSLVIRQWVRSNVLPAVINSPHYSPVWEQQDYYEPLYQLLQAKAKTFTINTNIPNP